jgi:hypothetical protein
VNLILEAISNSVSALPAAASVAQPGSVQRLGGFASTLAAAQGLSTTSQNAAGVVQASNGPVVQSTGAAVNLNVRMLTAGNSALKRLSSDSSAILSPSAALNIVVPGFIPETANQIPSPPLRSSLLQPRLMQPSPVQPSAPATPPAALRAQVPDSAARAFQPGLQMTAYVAGTQSTPVSYSALGPTAGKLGSFTSPDSIAGDLTNPSTPATLIRDVSGQTNGQETATANGAPPPLSTAAGATALTGGLPNPETRSQWNSSQDGPAAEGPMLVAESMQPRILSATTGRSAPGTPSPDVVKGGQVITSVTAGPGLGSAGQTLQADQAGGPTAFSPTLPANARIEAEPAPGVLLAFADLHSGQAKAANVTATDTIATNPIATNPIATNRAVQTDLSAQTGTGNPVSGIVNAQISASAPSIFNPSAQLAPARAALQFAVPRVGDAVATPNVRGVGRGAEALASIPTSALSTGPDSGKGLPLASQTPFSVFFSSPGPGTESAASVLPKMMLPVTSSPIRDSHATGTEAPSTSPQTSGLQNASTHNAAPQITRDSSARAESGSVAAGPPPRREGEVNAASVQLAASHIAVAPAPVAPTSAAVTLPLSGPAALVADSLPKTGTLPGAAPGGTANMAPAVPVPVVPERPAAVVPGPVQMAQIVSRVQQSEMRIGMNTSAFGSVEVRAVVHANDVGLVIGSEKGDLRSLLSNDMPVIANTLQEQNLRLHSVNFMQGFAFSNNASGGGDSQPRSFVPMRTAVGLEGSEATADDSIERLLPAEFGGGRSSLSILA